MGVGSLYEGTGFPQEGQGKTGENCGERVLYSKAFYFQFNTSIYSQN
jgi:hypothetical protein